MIDENESEQNTVFKSTLNRINLFYNTLFDCYYLNCCNSYCQQICGMGMIWIFSTMVDQFLIRKIGQNSKWKILQCSVVIKQAEHIKVYVKKKKKTRKIGRTFRLIRENRKARIRYVTYGLKGIVSRLSHTFVLPKQQPQTTRTKTLRTPLVHRPSGCFPCRAHASRTS